MPARTQEPVDAARAVPHRRAAHAPAGQAGDADRGERRVGSRSPLIAGIEPWALIALVAAVLIGAAFPGVVGLGLGLVLAPVTGLVAPQLLPGLALWLAML